MEICIAQMNYNSESIQAHVEKIKQTISDHRDADLIVFPELILQGHPSFERPEGFLYRRMKIAYGAVSTDIYRFTQSIGARVILGELKRRGDKYYNLATYIGENSVQSYVKTHVHWTENFVPGKRLKVFETPMGAIGINICFDAAFSEVWRTAALMGARVIVNISAVPASFPVDYMWRRFVGAAIFNQVFVINANRPGDHFSGHSAVFGPAGDLLINAGATDCILTAAIDPCRADEWRQEEVLFPNRRPLLYREVVKGPQVRKMEESIRYHYRHDDGLTKPAAGAGG